MLEQGLLDVNEASEELEDLQVRYGDLVTEEAMEGEKVWGFGTVKEMVSPRKRE